MHGQNSANLSVNIRNIMHMSLACPGGRPLAQPADGLDSLPLGRGKFATLFLAWREEGGELQFL